MIWSTQSPERRTAADTGLPEHLLSLLSSVVAYFSARMELAGLEGKEAAVIYGKIFAFLAIAVGLLLFGYIFLWIGLIVVIAQWVGYWGWITLGVGVLHLLGTMVCLLLVKAKWGKPVFTETLQEFKKDQEWLNNTTAKRN